MSLRSKVKGSFSWVVFVRASLSSAAGTDLCRQ